MDSDPKDAAALLGMEPDSLVAMCASYADQARNPYLDLGLFLDTAPSQVDLPESALRETYGAVAVDRARARKGALIVAANTALDELLESLVADDDDEDFVDDHFPPRYRHRYDGGFKRAILVTIAKVSADLASPHGGYPACTAEELTLAGILEEWEGLLDTIELGQPWTGLTEFLFEDSDYEYLYDPEYDGVEDDPLASKVSGLVVEPLSAWFKPFSAKRVVHPFTVDLSPRPVTLYDLTRLTAADAQTDPLGDAPDAAVRGFEPVSEPVRGGRIEARQAVDGPAWVPDETDPERSLAMSGLGRVVSGHLTHQPGPDAAITSVAVLSFELHRAHPITGIAYAEVMHMSGRVDLPVSAIVSFEPDPEVRKRWESTFKQGGLT